MSGNFGFRAGVLFAGALTAAVIVVGVHPAAAVAASAPTFAPGIVMPGVLNTQTTISADLNGDGLPDLVTGATIYDPNQQGIFNVLVTQMNLGRMHFGPALQTTLGPEHAGNGIDALAAGDLDRDGKADVVVGIADVFTRAKNIAVVRGLGDGAFGQPQWYAPSPPNFAPGPRVHSLALADVSGDGLLDIVVEGAGNTYRQMSVLRGRGNGSFKTPVLSAPLPDAGDVMGILVGDMNHDGIPDLVIPEQLGNSDFADVLVHIERGNGNGTFVEASQIETDTNPVRSQLADVNNDGRLDLVMSGYGGTDGGRGGVFIFIAGSNGKFNTPTQYSIDAVDLVAADFNGDGNVDLATGGQNANGTRIFAEIRDGNGTGSFPITPTVNIRTKGYMVLGLDVNADGRPDLVTQVVGAAPKIAIYKNTTP